MKPLIECNVLLIAPKFYNYDFEIKEELSLRCNNIFLKNDLPFSSPTRYYMFGSVFGFLNPKIWKRYEKDIYKIIDNNKIDIIFLIKGELIPERLLKAFKEKGLFIVYYQWDSVNNNPNSLIISKYADKCFTFDMEDHIKYPKFDYLPLFYNWKTSDGDKLIAKHYDLMFFGSWSYERFRIFQEIRQLCNSKGMTIYAQLYMPLQSLIRRLVKSGYFPYKLLRFRPMTSKEYYNLMRNSDLIFDVPSKMQTGTSMRTIEALSLKKKIITTNSNVKSESFYHPDNILIWPEEKSNFDLFVKKSYNPVSISKILSLKQWLSAMGL